MKNKKLTISTHGFSACLLTFNYESFTFIYTSRSVLPYYAWLRAPSTLWSEVTVQINADHYIEGKLCSLWTSECESKFEKQCMEI